MKTIDCFLFNNEVDILLLRLEVMSGFVDRFVVIETSTTFSGLLKKSIFRENQHLFKEHLYKIDYYFIEGIADIKDPWEKEHFLRNELKVRSNAADADTIIISDVDEIINLSVVFKKYNYESPSLIELKTYYYFLNNQSSEIIKVSLIAPYKTIKDYFVGDRNDYKNWVTKYITDDYGENGGHFTYQFGKNINKYINKIQSFSHQEYNNSYFLNTDRLRTCVKYRIDLFDRFNYRYTIVDLQKYDRNFYNHIERIPQLKEIYLQENFFDKFSHLSRFFNFYYLRYLKLNCKVKLYHLKKKIISN